MFLKERYRKEFGRKTPQHEQDFRVRLEFKRYDHSAVYIPVYYVESQFMKEEDLATFVDGYSGRVIGVKHLYDPTQIGLITSMLTSSIGLLISPIEMITLKSLGLWASIWSLLPFVSSRTVAKTLPTAQLMWQGIWMRLEAGDTTHALQYLNPDKLKYLWDLKTATEKYANWKKRATEEQQAIDYFEYQAYMRSMGIDPKENASSNSGNGRNERIRHPDPKGYYAMLGLTPMASKEEIQIAFRELALKFHPVCYSIMP